MNWTEYAKYAVAIREAERREQIPEGTLVELLSFDSDTIAGKGRHKLGAIGIALMTPEVANRFGVKDRTNPFESIAGAARYLRWLYHAVGSWKRAAEAFKRTEQNEVKNNHSVSLTA